MTSSSNNTPTNDSRREAARRMVDRQARRDRNVKIYSVLGILLVLLIVVGVAVGVVNHERNAPVATPNNVDGYQIGVSDKVKSEGKKVPVTIIQDYNCPGCQQLHLGNIDALNKMSNEGTIDLKFQNVAILDNATAKKDGSARASNAAACVADSKPDKFSTFNHLLYENQKPGEVGMTNDELKTYAQKAGASVDDCIDKGTFRQWVAKSNQDGASKIKRTPTVFIDGQELSDNSKLVDAIESAHKKLNP